MSTTPTRAKRRRQVRIASKPKVPLPPQLQRVNLNAAGIDIGSEEHWPLFPGPRSRRAGRAPLRGLQRRSVRSGRLAQAM